MPHRILVPLSCHAAARMRGREPCRSASFAGQVVGNCARRIDEGSLWNPPASGGVWCFGLESNQRMVWDALSLITGIQRIMKPWPVWHPS